MPVTFAALAHAYPGFRTLPGGLAERVAGNLRPFHPGRYRELKNGEGPARVPFLTNGSLQVALPLASGRQVPIYTLTPGDWCVSAMAPMFGQQAPALTTMPRASARGATLPASLVRSCLDAHPALGAEAFTRVVARVLHLIDVMGRLAATTVDQRLASLLIERGPHLAVTHQGLADELGTVREVVSRALEHFAADGLVRLRRAHIEVADAKGLAGRRPPVGDLCRRGRPEGGMPL